MVARGAWLVALLLAATAAPAQPTPGADAAPEWIRPEEVPARADALLRRLEASRADAEAESVLGEVEGSLNSLGRDLDEIFARARETVAESAPPADLEDLLRELQDTAAPLADWKRALEAEAGRVAEVLDEIARSERIWAETRRRPETASAGAVVVRRVGASIAALQETAHQLRPWRARVLAASDRVIALVAAVDAALDKLRAAIAAERASLLVPDRAPLWTPGRGGAIAAELPRVRGEIGAYSRSTRDYIARDARPLIVHALLGAVLMIVLGRFAARVRARLAGEEMGSRAARLLECPYAAGLLIALLATPVFHPLAPRRFIQLVGIVALFPAARIVVHASARARLAEFVGLLALMLLDRLGLAIAPLSTLVRLVFLLKLTVGIGVAIGVWRRARRDGAARWLRRAAGAGAVGLGLAFVAEVGGWTDLARLIGRGILASAVAGVYIYAAAIALSALFAFALASRTFRRSHLVVRNAAILQRRSERVLRWLGAALWLYVVLTAVGLREAASSGLAWLFDAGVSVGALSISLGGVLAFVVTLLSAFLLARVLTGVLEEDVYPRTSLPRGVPYALSTLVRYGVYSLGFLFALAAAGVQLGQVAIMLGGLGIGIGLGLQDLVKNFAAGLTLLLERRVQVGDTLEVPSQSIFGRVLSIGMRASVVRGWNGAEVVVPNSDLVASAVTNWTLTDRLCRIELPVGVAYGTDPERVVALLLDAVRSVDLLLADPAPQALFKGFGESSLDFVVRAWTDEGYDHMLSLTSRLGLAVHRCLQDAGITIPFPQRDLHLASVSPVARAALSGAGEQE